MSGPRSEVLIFRTFFGRILFTCKSIQGRIQDFITNEGRRPVRRAGPEAYITFWEVPGHALI